MERRWKCPTCGAMNAGDGARCRICKLMPIPTGAVASPPASSSLYAPPPFTAHGPPMMPPPPAPPPPSFLPPPGGWQELPAPAGLSTLPPPPGNYPPPPPGWYPGAPEPKRKRRVWPIVVGVVVPVLVLIGVGLVFVRGEDPHAAADRDEAEKALLTNHDLGGTFSEVEHRAFARSRGGLRVTGGLSECAPSDAVLEDDGQAIVDTALQSLNGISAQILAEEIIIMGSPDSATPMVDSITATARRCVSAAVEAGAASGGGSVSVSLSPSVAPGIGDRAAAFEGSMGIAGGQLAASVEMVIVQQGRAVVLLLVVDTTGSLHGDRLVSMVNTTLMRLAPRFGP